jgi:hypothetical protein
MALLCAARGAKGGVAGSAGLVERSELLKEVSRRMRSKRLGGAVECDAKSLLGQLEGLGLLLPCDSKKKSYFRVPYDAEKVRSFFIIIFFFKIVCYSLPLTFFCF